MKYILLFFLLVSQSYATFWVTNGTDTDVQAKGDAAAVSGDTIIIPCGNFTWNTGVTWGANSTPSAAGRSMTVKGCGVGMTNITVAASKTAFAWDIHAQFKVRITGITFIGDTSTGAIALDASLNSGTSVYGWRIDHVDLNKCNIAIIGIAWGVVDHFTAEGDMDFVLVDASSALDNTTIPPGLGNGQGSWGLPLHRGSKEAVYIENAVFSETTGNLAVNDMEWGGRIVYRHNLSHNTYIQSHSSRTANRSGNLNAEIYDNTFDSPLTVFRAFLILGGSGLIYNNTITGYQDNRVYFGDQRASQQVVAAPLLACDGTHTWDQNIAANGWPCLDQIGRGPVPSTSAFQTEPSVPFYLWNNGSTATCATGGTCSGFAGVALNGSPVDLGTYIQNTAHSNGDIDYCTGTTTMPTSCGNHTNNYAPFVFPHPLTLPPPLRTFGTQRLPHRMAIGLISQNPPITFAAASSASHSGVFSK